jgi:hypothetical protein
MNMDEMWRFAGGIASFAMSLVSLLNTDHPGEDRTTS